MAIERIFVMTSPSRATGRCHCGNIHYSMPTEVVHHALCHCSDCRRHAGAPLVGWGLVGQDALEVSGTPQIYTSSEHSCRPLCGDCRTAISFPNTALFPGQLECLERKSVGWGMS